jgi:dolichyl-diphosphooligosaccharide--protein glycosyltransferase
MHRENEQGSKKGNKPGTRVPPLSIEIATILLVFLGSRSIVSLLYAPQRLSVQGSLDLVALAALPLAYGIWMRKKWAFCVSLILLEALMLISPLIAAFSPYFGLKYNWISLLSFIGVGLAVLPLLISNEHHFGFLKEAKLQKVIKNLPIFNTLFIIFGIALIIRTVLPYDSVFKDTVRFASDDAVFHMRLVENALFGDHFPRRLFFDAYTYFPHGTYLHFAPLFDQLLIFATWIIGLGSPTRALMEAVGAYYPAILGALVVFPVYIIGREVYNKYAGLIAAIVVATLPGQFLSRSIIGFTDHHVGEVLFSTIAVMFLTVAIKRTKEELPEGAFLDWFARSPGEWVRGKNFPFLCYAVAILVLFQVMPWEWWVFLSLILFLLALIIFHLWEKPDSYAFYTILAGMALGFYLLTWVGGLFFVVIFILFGVLQYTLNGLRSEPNEYLCITLTPLFFIPLLMILPFFGPSYPFYNIQQVGSLSVGVITFSIPLIYRYLLNKFGYRHGLVRERIAKAELTKPEKIGTGEYTCPICGRKSRGGGIIEHIKTKHHADIEKKDDLVKIRRFFDEYPELSVGLKKLGIGPILGVSPFAKISKYDYLLPVLTLAVLLGLSGGYLGSFLSVLTPGGTALTIAEVHPMDSGTAWIWFSTPFFIALFAMGILALDLVLKNRPERVLLLVWSIIMFVTVGGLGIFGIEDIGQNRFAYYYAINAAILTGLFFAFVFEFLTGIGEEAVKRGSPADARSKKGGKARRSEAPLDLRLLIFALAIMIIFVIGVVQVGLEALIPLVVIGAIFFVWMHGANTKKSIESPLRKTLAILLIMVFVFYPFPLNAVAKPFPSTTNLPLSATYAINTAKGGIGAEEDWYEALRWMRNNTPEPGVGYYELYEEPPLNETTGMRGDYDYPDSAYGVMSWWDYGHIITWIAHRIPNANPFQAGIGGPIGSGSPGACVFFIVDNENEANEVADVLGVRYVVSDFMMADIWNALYNKYYAMTVWAGNPPSYNTPSYYYRTTEARLHMFDGASVEVDGESIAALAHYRLVHESPTFVLPLLVMDENTGYMYWRHFSGDYETTAAQAQILHGWLFSMSAGVGIEEDLDEGLMPEMLKSAFNSTIPLSEDSTVAKGNEGRWIVTDEENGNLFFIEKKGGTLNAYLYGWPTGQPNIKAWTPEYLQPVSFVKVFEYVKGARIEGTALNGSLIEVSTTITTNQGRNFTYSARTTANDSSEYEFIVPYSTEGPIEGGTNFDVSVSPYTIRAGHFENEAVVWDVEEEVRIHEEDVMEGRTINVDLL